MHRLRLEFRVQRHQSLWYIPVMSYLPTGTRPRLSSPEPIYSLISERRSQREVAPEWVAFAGLVDRFLGGSDGDARLLRALCSPIQVCESI